MRLAADPSRKIQNQFAVYRLLLDGQTRTREEVVALSGLSRSTIEKVFATLRQIGAIRAAGQRASRGGRPHQLYELDPAYRYLVAVDFPIPELTVAVVDLANQVSYRSDTTIRDRHPLPALDAIRLVHEEVERCLARAKVERHEVLSLNVSLPGPVIGGQSTIQNRDVADWLDVPLADELQRVSGIRTFATNDVANMMTSELHARGEIGTTVPNDVSNTLFLALRRGTDDGVRVGAAYAIPTGSKFQVFHGSITHYATGIQTATCRCGNRGCLERALQDLGRPPAVSDGSYQERVAGILAPVLNSLCRFTEARRVILDLSGVDGHARPLHDLIESRLRNALARGPLHDTVVETPVAPEDASLRGAALNGLQTLLSEPLPSTAFFDLDPSAGRRDRDEERSRSRRTMSGTRHPTRPTA